MKKIRKVIFIVFIFVMCGCLGMTADAKSKDVTKRYKSTVTKMIRPFDNYLCYEIAYDYVSEKFIFNDYTKTSMILYSDTGLPYNYPANKAKKRNASRMKLYFGSSAKFKLKKRSNGMFFVSLPYLYQNDNGKTIYVGGEYAEDDVPYGKVSNIISISGSQYVVKYKMYMKSRYGDYSLQYRGTYQIYLKREKNKYGFIITDIKRTHVAK
jgi:hypothetical protein